MLGTVPKPIKVALTYFGVFVGVVVIFKYAKLGQSEKTFLIIALIVLGVITAGYYAWKAWMAEAAATSSSAAKSPSTAPPHPAASAIPASARGSTHAEEIPIRQSRPTNRAARTSTNLPWYVIVGEPAPARPRRSATATSVSRRACRTSSRASAARST